MFASDIMIKDVFYAKKNDTIGDILRLFVERRISGVPIVDDEMHLVGYISDGDIMRYISHYHDNFHVFFTFSTEYFTYLYTPEEEENLEKNALKNHFLDMCQHPVTDIATKKVICVKEDEEIKKISTILSSKKIKKVPVEKDGKLIGIISRGDVIRNVVSTFLEL